MLTIVSGGQTGVDRAALDVAIARKIPHEGWCPKGRKAEDGIIQYFYNLKETETEDYEQRTKLNVRDSDGTLIILRGKAIGGTFLTIQEAEKLKKPLFVYDFNAETSVSKVVAWVKENKIKKLNIAGPRESQTIGIYKDTFNLISEFANSFIRAKI